MELALRVVIVLGCVFGLGFIIGHAFGEARKGRR